MKGPQVARQLHIKTYLTTGIKYSINYHDSKCFMKCTLFLWLASVCIQNLMDQYFIDDILCIFIHIKNSPIFNVIFLKFCLLFLFEYEN